ncbi:hypothetical protein PoMZ_00417 [Pyricularia oryzae]|uniref:Uncharacterized protein n=1 Tax=Pyricularia oryzae TaxID=318829 RepID=A0A4P7MZP5_PYROR|nr:hypothetical protein PoMZ_00417 [Pyricularia oryzae]
MPMSLESQKNPQKCSDGPVTDLQKPCRPNPRAVDSGAARFHVPGRWDRTSLRLCKRRRSLTTRFHRYATGLRSILKITGNFSSG